jgi:hypothetical protein
MLGRQIDRWFPAALMPTKQRCFSGMSPGIPDTMEKTVALASARASYLQRDSENTGFLNRGTSASHLKPTFVHGIRKASVVIRGLFANCQLPTEN